MKVAVQCPNCGEKKMLSVNLLSFIFLCIITLGIYGIKWSLKNGKCPKCDCMMQSIVNVQNF